VVGYTLQDMSFSGSLSFYQGEREVRVLELGVGHSESDVVVHLPGEKIVLTILLLGHIYSAHQTISVGFFRYPPESFALRA
jgi:hypothetical protein